MRRAAEVLFGAVYLTVGVFVVVLLIGALATLIDWLAQV